MDVYSVCRSSGIFDIDLRLRVLAGHAGPRLILGIGTHGKPQSAGPQQTGARMKKRRALQCAPTASEARYGLETVMTVGTSFSLAA